ncbi:MAG: choice-of-anchor D domain-containing protein [Candidatus Competibacteraceae bacterium]|nr:choice-of-anchor D domain-containing protein [Candidatus Competibacteraceae bacterium]
MGKTRDKGSITMKIWQLDQLWAKAATLALISLWLMLLPDWGIELRAQTLPTSPTLSPTQLNFGSVPVGTTSPPQTVTLTNPDPQFPIAVNSITATSSFSSTSCPQFLLPLSSCTISLTFSPGTLGTQTGTLSAVVDTCLSAPCIQTLTAALTGVGISSINAVNDTASTAAGTPVSINVLANDTGTGLSLNQVSRPSNGTAVISGNTVIYTPAASFAGSDSFSYTVTDSFGQSASATVTVTVNPPGLNAVNDTASTAAGTPVSINVLANDTGTGLSLNQVSRPSNGTAVISGNTVIYTPAASFAGSDSFSSRFSTASARAPAPR